jgi:hypothetical protein
MCGTAGGLQGVKLGGQPVTKDEMRQWIKDILGVIAKGASLTPTVIDDNCVAMVLRAVENDMLYDWVYGLIERWLVDEDDPILVGDPVNDEVLAASAVAAINPLVVIAVIKALIALWKSFR